MRPLAWQLPQRVRALESSTSGRCVEPERACGSARRAPRSTRAPARAASPEPGARPTLGCRRRPTHELASLARAPPRAPRSEPEREGLPEQHQWLAVGPAARRRAPDLPFLELAQHPCGVLAQQPLDRAVRGVPWRADAQAFFVDQDRDRAPPRAALDRVADERAVEREMRAADSLLLPEARAAGRAGPILARLMCPYPLHFVLDPLLDVLHERGGFPALRLHEPARCSP